MEQKKAFFYSCNYYLIPGDIDFDKFLKKYKNGAEFEYEKLVQNKCLAPYFVSEEIVKEKLVLSGKVYPAEVFVCARKEYNDKLRKIVAKHCEGCPNFSFVDETEESLNGHHEEISLNNFCFVRDASEREFQGDYVNYNDKMDCFCDEFKENLQQIEDLLDKNKIKNVYNFFANNFNSWLGIKCLNYYGCFNFYVGKHKKGKYYLYFTSLFDQRLAMVARSLLYKIKQMGLDETWDIKDYIPQGFIPKQAIKPKHVNFEILEYEHKYIKITLPCKDEDKAMNMILWLMGTIGENRFKSICEGYDLQPKIKDSKKTEDLISEMNSILESIPETLQSSLPVVVMPRVHDEKLVGIRTYYSSEIMQFMDEIKDDDRSNIFWGTHYFTAENELPLFRATFKLKNKLNFEDISKLYADEDVSEILQTPKYIADKYSGALAGFDACEDKVIIYGMAYNLAELKRTFSYLSPICEAYGAELDIFTHSQENGGKYKVSYEMKKIQNGKK